MFILRHKNSYLLAVIAGMIPWALIAQVFEFKRIIVLLSLLVLQTAGLIALIIFLVLTAKGK